MALSVNQTVRVNTRIAGGGSIARDFGRTMIVTEDETLPPGGSGKVGVYADLSSVARVFGTSSKPYVEAAAYFARSPFPRNLLIVRRVVDDADTVLRGGDPTSTDPADYAGIADGSASVLGENFEDIDFSGDADLSDVAASLQTGLRMGVTSGLSTCVVAWDSAAGRWTLSLPDLEAGDRVTNGIASPVAGNTGNGTLAIVVNAAAVAGTYRVAMTGATTFTVTDPDGNVTTDITVTHTAGSTANVAGDAYTVAVNVYDEFGDGTPLYLEAHSGGTGTDVSVIFALREDDGAELRPGADAEDLGDALADAAEDHEFYGIVADATIRENRTTPAAVAEALNEIATWAQGGVYFFFGESNELVRAVRTANESTTALARVAAGGRDRAGLFWSPRAQGLAASIAGRFSGINYEGVRTVINVKFLDAPQVDAANIDQATADELDRKRVNYYALKGRRAIVQQGVTTQAGGWIDTRIWLDWFTSAVRTAIFDLLAREDVVPLTPDGIAALRGEVAAVCGQGVRNGGIAPGTVSAALRAEIARVTDDSAFDGFLSNGYLVVIGALADLTQTQRANRRSPPIKVYLKGAGAINFVDADLTFED